MNSTNTVVANAMAARNAAPKGLTPTTKLRLKEDFSDEYGSYRKGDVFPMYAMGGINPRFGTMMVPGRGVTLQIPWEKLEVVNAVSRRVARNATGYVKIASELDLIETACIKAERAMELEGARISLKPIMDAYRKVRAQVSDWWEDKKRREAL